MEKLINAKTALNVLLAGLSAVLGWFGWMVVAFVACLFLDYITGSLAAGKMGQWGSRKAWEGLWHKLGSIVAVGTAAIADCVLGLIINNIPALTLPFHYTVMLCPLVLVWYIFTELGSIAENAQILGAPIPPFLKKVLAVYKSGTEELGEKMTDR